MTGLGVRRIHESIRVEELWRWSAGYLRILLTDLQNRSPCHQSEMAGTLVQGSGNAPEEVGVRKMTHRYLKRGYKSSASVLVGACAGNILHSHPVYSISRINKGNKHGRETMLERKVHLRHDMPRITATV
ncbi:hypothetical protein Tco_1525452 [Tanacetum coccineum]